MTSHTFSATATWSGGETGQGVVEAPGMPSAAITLPAQFDGTVPGTNPEELLLSSLASCLTMTFAFLLESREVAFRSLHTEAVGTFVSGPSRPTAVEVSMSIVTPAGSDCNLLQDLAKRAEERCMISTLLRKSAEVAVRLEIVEGT
jgi:peroxiredoxin-like protein